MWWEGEGAIPGRRDVWLLLRGNRIKDWSAGQHKNVSWETSQGGAGKLGGGGQRKEKLLLKKILGQWVLFRKLQKWRIMFQLEQERGSPGNGGLFLERCLSPRGTGDHLGVLALCEDHDSEILLAKP